MKNKDTNNDFTDEDIFYCDDDNLIAYNIEESKESQKLVILEENTKEIEDKQDKSFDTILKIIVTLLVLGGAITGSILFAKNNKLITLNSSPTENTNSYLTRKLSVRSFSNIYKLPNSYYN